VSNDARYMPLYVGAYLADTAHLSTVAHGAYLLLIMNYWQRGSALPSSDRKLASIARLTDVEWASIRDDLAEFFIEENGLWRHGKIDVELRRAAQKIDAAKRAGEASANARAQAKSTTYQQPLDEPSTDAEQPSNHKVRIGKEDIKDKPNGLSKKGCRLPDDWEPLGDVWDMADEMLGEVKAAKELAKFRDYWRGVSGKGGVKLDWDATWRNWVRKAAEQKPRGQPPPKPKSVAELAWELAKGFDSEQSGENGTERPLALEARSNSG
jgi:uncharacterized protein YdaU (DUF1376 family)